ncbi:molybdenum cofactor biosynthesis prote [Rickenella mellea]|uniref:Molybdenum cofactor biosynthesis prote n=1 Tax=Rickenella mellea TaxID=50990 RepID=A0A4Y7QLZ2_9AGAM|nr:molybdenum cofactor biosynthesis prote [Rickenella mellea]
MPVGEHHATLTGFTGPVCRLHFRLRFRHHAVPTNTQDTPTLSSISPHTEFTLWWIRSSSSSVDTFRRKHDYLRISLTERCNLRCFYCMPNDGVELSPPNNILSDDEILRLAKLFVQSGVKKIRLTGGEPTVRKGLANLVGRINELRIHGLQSIGMTSNGLALHRKLPLLIENGLTHLNLSLDTLDPLKFEILTRRTGHDGVLKSLEVAMASALHSVKLNVVVIRGLNDSEVLHFVNLTKDNPITVRFIEFMPFTGNKWDKDKLVPASELLERISGRFPGAVKLLDEPHDTSRNYAIPGHRGRFGFISSMSDHFCGSCNRLRITADGQIKVCLFDSKEVSLRDLIRSGVSDVELLAVIRQALSGKKAKHAGMENIDVVTNRPMILIGAGTYALNAGKLSHLNESGSPRMVDITSKEITRRTASAQGRIYIPTNAYEIISKLSASKSKGDVLTVAQLAGIMACKKTSDLIPLCHPIPLSHIEVRLTIEAEPSHGSGFGHHSLNGRERRLRHSILCQSTVTCDGKTGVEMEALTAVTASLLTVWDMLKAVAGTGMVITDTFVTSKTGGKSGDFFRPPRRVDDSWKDLRAPYNEVIAKVERWSIYFVTSTPNVPGMTSGINIHYPLQHFLTSQD